MIHTYNTEQKYKRSLQDEIVKMEPFFNFSLILNVIWYENVYSLYFLHLCTLFLLPTYLDWQSSIRELT